MKRKITSLLMALIMTLSLAVPAFASFYEISDNPSSDMEQTMTFAAKTRVPVLSLSLPQLGTNPIVFNPYQIKYDATVTDTDTLNGDNGVTNPTDQTKQIISPVYAIRNLTDTTLTVGVKATTTLEGNLSLASAAPAASSVKNEAYIHLDLMTTKPATTITLPTTSVEQNIQTLATTNSSEIETGVQTLVLQGAKDTAKSVEIKVTDTTSGKSALTLAQTAGGDQTSNANYLFFQFNGEAVKNPTTAWAASDKFTTVLTFTFQPSAATPAATTADINKQVTYTAGTAPTVTIASTDLPTGHDIDGTTPAWTLTGAATGVTMNATSGVITIPETALTSLTNSGDHLDITGTVGWTKSDSSNGTATIKITVTKS